MSDPSRDVMEQIAALMRARDVDTPLLKLPCEVTACIPVFDSLTVEFGTLMNTLHSLIHQSTQVKLVFCDNGSRDGSQVLLDEMSRDTVTRAFWLERFPHGIKVAETVPQNEDYPRGQRRMNVNMKLLHQRMLDLVDTPYVVTVDSDVEVPRGGIRTMLDCLKDDPDIGMVGIGYPPNADHVQHGLLMMETEFKRSLGWESMPVEFLKRCTCKWLNERVKNAGKRVVRLDPLSARHTKLET